MLSDELAQRESVRLPPDFRLYRDRGGSHLPPWTFLTDRQAIAAKEMLLSQYPQYHDCLPFADTDASDDIAVFTPDGRVREVHMFASQGWEGGGDFPHFRDWLRATFEQVYVFLETADGTD